MLDDLRRVLASEPAISYALVFGSAARESLHSDSDVDVAIELLPGAPRDVLALGALAARLESAVRRRIDLVLLDEAPPPLAYRVFRDGQIVLEHDHAALVRRKARAVLEYLDFKPIEDLCADGVLRAAARGR